MAVVVKTQSPYSLLIAIKDAIANDEVETWSCDSDGDFTHAAPQWRRKAWFRPDIRDGRLVFNIIPPRTGRITRTVYGIYHGRLVEMLLNHFDKQFTDASATALPVAGDRTVGSGLRNASLS